ncbi:MAG: sodium/proline symporter [Candidatus Poseidoniaceae archaeon]
MEIGVLLSFLLFLGLFAGVGLSSMRVKENTTEDYLVAGRGVHPALAALSAVSTWNSGYMFVGIIGFTWAMGYSVFWTAFASTLGQIIAWVWIYKFIQKEANERGVRSLSSLVSSSANAPEAKLAAIISVVFLSIYAAAQLTAGGKALELMLDWPIWIGILIGAGLAVAYCFAGGIRASIWTDGIQSIVMMIGGLILCVVAVKEVGGIGGLTSDLRAIDPGLANLFPKDYEFNFFSTIFESRNDTRFGFTLWALAFFLGGIGVAGQPQVVTRVMTLGDDKDRKQAAWWFFIWQTPFFVLMLLVGFVARVLFDGLENFDPENGLIEAANTLLSPFFVGLILASIFAATMSTADSQILACTAAITEDITPQWREDHKKTKMITLSVAAFATAISLGGLFVPGGDSVFELVVIAVYGLGGIFIPLLTLRMLKFEPDTTHAIVMMVSALSAVIIWRVLGLNEAIFESIPGMGAAFIAHFLLVKFRSEEGVSPFGKFDIPDKNKLATFGAIFLVAFAISETTYLVLGPDPNATGGNKVQIMNMNQTIFSSDVDTVSINEGETSDFEFVFDQEEAVVTKVELIISWTEGGLFEECDEITINPKLDGLDGPIDDAGQQITLDDCSGTELVALTIIPNQEILDMITENTTGSVTSFNSTESEITALWNKLSDTSRISGTWNAEFTVSANGGSNPFNDDDDGQEIQAYWKFTQYTRTGYEFPDA